MIVHAAWSLVHQNQSYVFIWPQITAASEHLNPQAAGEVVLVSGSSSSFNQGFPDEPSQQSL